MNKQNNSKLKKKSNWTRNNLNSFLGKLFAYTDLTFVDHGIFRIFWKSQVRLSTEMYRSNQPYPSQIQNAYETFGIKTIINLRGKRDCSSYYLEEKKCKELNINLINFPVSSRAAPKKTDVIGASELFKKIEYPALMHCKSGADRAGLMAALYMIFRKEEPTSVAKKQLSFKYLHIRQSKTGILDAFFDYALESGANRPDSFLKWIKSGYNEDFLKKKFTTSYRKLKIIDLLLRRE